MRWETLWHTQCHPFSSLVLMFIEHLLCTGLYAQGFVCVKSGTLTKPHLENGDKLTKGCQIKKQRTHVLQVQRDAWLL